MHLCGSAALWYQTVQSSLLPMSWDDFRATIYAKFDKDEHNHLLRHFFHIRQTHFVHEYIEQLCDIVHQLLAHDPNFSTATITNRFVDGLKKEIKTIVMMHRPQDLDSASSLALLQEEAVLGPTNSSRKGDSTSSFKKSYLENSRVYSSGNPPRYSSSPGEDKKNAADTGRNKQAEDKLSTLKTYRKAKGLCFKCGKKWHPTHKCQNVSVQAMEEVWPFLSDDSTQTQSTEAEDTEFGDDLMSISVQAVKGTEGNTTIRLRGFIEDQEAYMLVDSGSTHCFISEAAAAKIQGRRALANPVTVRVANGSTLHCTHELPDQVWMIQGVPFKTTFKILPIGTYDAILGMDWLVGNSPMHVHWAKKWLQFQHKGKLLKIQGILSQVQVGSPISSQQLDAMLKQGSVWCCVQLNEVLADQPTKAVIPPEIQDLIDKYSEIFQPILGLPPQRASDHTIPLLIGATPFRLRPYRKMRLRSKLRICWIRALSNTVPVHSHL